MSGQRSDQIHDFLVRDLKAHSHQSKELRDESNSRCVKYMCVCMCVYSHLCRSVNVQAQMLSIYKWPVSRKGSWFCFLLWEGKHRLVRTFFLLIKVILDTRGKDSQIPNSKGKIEQQQKTSETKDEEKIAKVIKTQ